MLIFYFEQEEIDMKKFGIFFIISGIILFIMIGIEAYMTKREIIALHILLIGVLPICLGISIIKANKK